MNTKWSVKLTKIDNGFIGEFIDSDVKQKRAYQDKDGKSSIAECLMDMVEFFGEEGTRHDKERIHITTKQGDKYEKPNKR